MSGVAAAIAVYKDGNLHEAVYGSKSPTSCDPVNETTRFDGVRLADVVTALTALRVQEKGLIDLDNVSVTKYVPDLKLDAASEKWAPELTLRSLLSSSGGYFPVYWWPDDPGPCPSSFPAVGGDPGPGTLAKFFATYPAPIFHEPGTEFMYSAPGIALVARALAEVENKSFADVVKTEVADPSGLDLTYDPTVYENGNLAQQVKDVSDCELIWPNRGLYLDVQDLGKLVQAVASGGGGGSVLSTTEVSALVHGGEMPTTPDVGVSSLGFVATPLPDGVGTLVERNGHDASSASVTILVIPEQHFGFAALANRWLPGFPGSFVQEVFHTYFPQVTPYHHATDPSTWTEYEGTYQRDDGVQALIQVDAAQGTMSATIQNQTVQMTPSGIQTWMSTGGLKGSTDPDYFQLGGNIVRFYRDKTGVPVTLGFILSDGTENYHPFQRQ